MAQGGKGALLRTIGPRLGGPASRFASQQHDGKERDRQRAAAHPGGNGTRRRDGRRSAAVSFSETSKPFNSRAMEAAFRELRDREPLGTRNALVRLLAPRYRQKLWQRG